MPLPCSSEPTSAHRWSGWLAHVLKFSLHNSSSAVFLVLLLIKEDGVWRIVAQARDTENHSMKLPAELAGM